MDWLNVAFLRMNTLMGRGAVLVEFWDFARVNSLRTMPYLKAWHERYSDAGLRVIGIHSPGYSFGRDPDTVAAAVERLEVTYPVLLDPARHGVRVAAERVARAVDPDYLQAGVGVALVPGAQIGQRAQRVHAREVPELDQHRVPSQQAVHAHERRPEPRCARRELGRWDLGSGGRPHGPEECRIEMPSGVL